MGTFQPNRRRTQIPVNQSTTRSASAETTSQVPKRSRPTNLSNSVHLSKTVTPIPIPASHPIPLSASTPSNTQKPSHFPEVKRLPHHVRAIYEFDKLINFLLEHRPQVAERFTSDCWELYSAKYRKKNKNTQNPTPAPSELPQPSNPPAPASSHKVTAPTPNLQIDNPSLQAEANPTGSSDRPLSPSSSSDQHLTLQPIKASYKSNAPLLARQSQLENFVYQRWKRFESGLGTTAPERTPREDNHYVIWESSTSHKSPVLLDQESCCMALLDGNSKLSDLHLKALRFLWFYLIEDTCTGAIFNHGIGYPRTHMMYLFAKLVINSSEHAKSRILVICSQSSYSDWDMAAAPFISICINFLCKSQWQENINTWRERGGVLVANDEAYYNILTQSHCPDRSAAVAALVSPGPDICILDEASRTNNRPKPAVFWHLLNRTRTKSRLALTSLPLAGFISRTWSIVDWACPRLLGTGTEYQWRYADPIVRGHKRDASLDDAKLAFSKACVLYNKIGMVTFTIDSGTRKEALLSKGLSLYESVIWVNLNREEYAIYRDVEVFLKKCVTKENLSPFLASNILICAASSVRALRRTVKTWAEADSDYLESIGHRNTFAMHQESFLALLRIIDMHLQEGVTSTKLQLTLYLARQCLQTGERLVIFASSQELLEETHSFLLSQLDETRVHRYEDPSSCKERGQREPVVAFNTAPDGAILVAPYGPNSQCMEEAGWGFVNATRVLFIDSSWHSGACVQAVNRVHNFAQHKREAHVHHFLARETVELALSCVLDWTYKHTMGCDSTTLPTAMSSELDERAFLLAPEVSPSWIRDKPPAELSRSEVPIVNRSELGEQGNSLSSKEHDNLILPLQKTENTKTGDKCVHEIVLNGVRYRAMSENLDRWMRSEWTRKRRYLIESEDEFDRNHAVKTYRDVLHVLGGEMLDEAKRSGDSGNWLAQDSIFTEHDSSVCHLLSSWEPYRRLYERSGEIADLPAENRDRGEKRPRPANANGNPRKSRRCGEAGYVDD